MKYALSSMLVFVACVALAEQASVTNPPPSVREILDSVLAQMPTEPVQISGRLGVRDRGQTILRSYRVEIRLHVEGESLEGAYTLFGAGGGSLEQLRVSRPAGGVPQYEYAVGDPLKAAAAPDVFSTVRDTGVTWSDLALPFLWWRNGTLVGSASVKGRDCFVIDVVPREEEVRRPTTVRVWIDKKYRMLLQAEEYDAKARMLRRLLVQSFKKINDEWMVKDIIVEGSESLPTGYKSILTIHDMRSQGKSSPRDAAAANPGRGGDLGR